MLKFYERTFVSNISRIFSCSRKFLVKNKIKKLQYPYATFNESFLSSLKLNLEGMCLVIS